MDSAGRPDVSGRKRISSRLRVFSQRSTAARTSPTRQRAVARHVGLELAGIAEVHVVLIEQVRLAAEPADALQPGDELELLLRARAIELGRVGPVFASSAICSVTIRSISASERPGRAVACTTIAPPISAPSGNEFTAVHSGLS